MCRLVMYLTNDKDRFKCKKSDSVLQREFVLMFFVFDNKYLDLIIIQ